MGQQKLSTAKKIIFPVTIVVAFLIILELFSSVALLYNYRMRNPKGINTETSSLSLVNVAVKVAKRIDPSLFAQFSTTVSPSGYYEKNALLGYAAKPGKYQVTFSRKTVHRANWERFRTNVTINADRTRWTGAHRKANQPSIYIFGDSFVFGSGVNDEQTFGFLLQQAMPGFNVRLFALGGYSLSQAQLTFQRLRKQISSRDIVVLGYADFYEVRHVVAPSRLREIRDWTARFKGQGKPNNYLLPKAGLAQDGALKFSYISQDCDLNNGYCEQGTPPSSHMVKVTAALVNTIARGTAAKTYLLHFEGASNNPALEMLDKRVTHISALPGAFDYFIRDDVEAFDSHPGPYWHYAMFSKLLATLREQTPERSAAKLRPIR